MPTTTRSGPIHGFDGESAITPDRFPADPSRTAPVVVRTIGERGVLGRGVMRNARVEDGEIVADIDWPAEIEEIVGDGRPSARCEFAPDGSIRRVVIELEDDPGDDEVAHDEGDDGADCDCESCLAGEECPCEEGEAGAIEDEPEPEPEPEPAPRADRIERPMPKSNPEIDAVFDKLVDKYDGDPSRLAKALIKQNREMAAKVAKEDDAVVPKADAELLAAVRELGDPAKIKADLDALAAYRELGEPAKVKATLADLARDRDAAAAELGGLKRKNTLAEVAAAAGYDGPAARVFAGLVRPDMAFEPVKVKDRGREVDTFRATWKGEDGQEISKTLAELEADDWAAYAPALRPDARPAAAAARAASATGFRGEIAGPARSTVRETPVLTAFDRTRDHIARNGLVGI